MSLRKASLREYSWIGWTEIRWFLFWFFDHFWSLLTVFKSNFFLIQKPWVGLFSLMTTHDHTLATVFWLVLTIWNHIQNIFDNIWPCFTHFWPQIQATLFKNSPLVLAFSSCLCRLRPVRLNESRQIQFDVLLPLIFVCFLLHTKWCSTKTAERKMTCEYIFHLPGRTRALLQLQFRPETINLQVMQNSRLL